MRERLKELICEVIQTDECIGRCNHPYCGECERHANHLLANGVVVPPVSDGQTVWFIRNHKIIETKVDKIVLKYGGLYIKLDCNSMYETSCNSIGKTVFLTKEEAEQKLKEGKG